MKWFLLVGLVGLVLVTLRVSGPTSPQELLIRSDTISPPVSREKEASAAPVSVVPLAVFAVLAKKALRTKEEEDVWRRTLASDTVREDARAKLLAPASSDKTSLRERFQALHYFERALGWRENPARNALIADLSGLLMREVPSEMAARKIVVGDKVEVFALLLREAPEEARALVKRTSDPGLTRILKFAQTRFIRE